MNQKSNKIPKERKLFNKIYVWEKEPMISDVDIDKGLEKVVQVMPKHFFRNIEGIYIGQFPELAEREIDALYADNAIYVSNTIVSQEEFVRNILHEIAHSLEESIQQNNDAEDSLVTEFLAKRNQLKRILSLNGYNVSKQDFENIEYDKRFDSFLYNEVGYPALLTLTSNVFASPYGATSYREYFANGFEHYFLNDYDTVKSLSKQLFLLFNKIQKPSFFQV